MRSRLAIPVICFVLQTIPAAGQPASDEHLESRVESVLGKLTLEEKLGQLQQLGGDPKTGGLL